jgi:enterochelin esterase-like enzyme
VPVHNFRRPQGRLVEIEIASQALEGNLLGDPTRRVVAVYLPPGYDEDPSRRYPLFVDLVGFTGSGLAHLNWKVFGESVPQRLDRLVEEGRMGPVVAAFPDCFTSLGGNQYIDSVALGRWEDFLIEEMLPRLEAEFRLLPGREHRAVFGKSSGGYGSIAHGLRRAEAWGAVACHSGDMSFDLCYRSHLPVTARFLAVKGGVAGFLEAFAAAPKTTEEWLNHMEMVAMAASYDPDPAAPKGIRLPVDPETAEMDEARWSAWKAHDPVELVRQEWCRENLLSLRGLYIDCGVNDQYHLVHGARAFARALRAAGIAHRFEEFDDDHTNVDYRMDVSLPYLYEALMGPNGASGG